MEIYFKVNSVQSEYSIKFRIKEQNTSINQITKISRSFGVELSELDNLTSS